MIDLSNINKSFAGKPALRDIDLFVQEGEIFGIIGKSGAGKSTLLRIINLLEKPDSGYVMVDGQDITRLNTMALRETRHKMGMIFQHFNLLANKTVYDNIALAMRIQGISEDQIKTKIDELLPVVELENKVHAYPAELSGGQKQRVAIARAISTAPKILLCDEATSALDRETTEAILQLLQKINQLYGITIVLITHEMDVVKHLCHRLALMEQGKIIELDSMAGIFNNADSLARKMLYAKLSPKLPDCLINQMVPYATEKPVLRLYFQGEQSTVPFISHASRELKVDINILLANIDRFDGITCGVLVVELTANPLLLNVFIDRCEAAGLRVEKLGYVTDDSF